MADNRRPDNMERITTPALAQAFIDEQVAAIREQVGDKKVLLALSGGVDSSVTAALLIKAIGKQLVCVHVNHGLLRKGEPEQVIQVFRNEWDANLIYVDATDRFLDKLAGVTDPETKRKIIGGEFIEVFAEEARKLDGVEFLAQGTIWPDILESEAGIKAHHNAGGLPEDLQFELVEPVKILFKVWQYFTVVPDFKYTGVKDGKRTFDWPCIIRAINTTDVMEVTVEHLAPELMDHLVKRIISEVPGINRVLYDLTPKPTGTIEWE